MRISLPEEAEVPFLVHRQPSNRMVTKGQSVYSQPRSPMQGAAYGVWAVHTHPIKKRKFSWHTLKTHGEHIAWAVTHAQKPVLLSHSIEQNVYDFDTAPISPSIGWRSIQSEIEQFARRPANWNSYGAQPISLPCKVMALELAGLLEAGHALGSEVNMTGDSDVIISCRIGGYKMKWQIDVDGEIAAMVHRQNGETSFHDLPFLHVRGFIKDLNDGVL